MKKFSALIIGAGNMGAFYDNPVSSMCLSHAHAFTSHEGFDLIGFIDSNHSKAEKAAELWGRKAYHSIKEAFDTVGAIDLAVVAVPDNVHYSVLMEVVKHPVRLVFAEKPLAISINEARDVIQQFEKRGVTLSVNYTRRFIPEFKMLKKSITTGDLGKFLNGSGYYGKGFLHNGSHMVDLLRYLLGDIESITETDKIVDYSQDDPSLNATVKINDNRNFYMIAIDARDYTIFELDLLFSKARIRLTNSAYTIEKSRIAPNKDFPGYHILETENTVRINIGNALLHAADNIHAFLAGGAPLECTGADGLEAVRLCTTIRNDTVV